VKVDTSINSNRLVRIFEQLKRDHGLPQVLCSGNGPEFLGEASPHGPRSTAWRSSTSSPASRTRTPISNDSTARSARRSWIRTRLDDVREAAHGWMIEYNELRPHDSLGDQTPAEVRQQSAEGSTSEPCA